MSRVYGIVLACVLGASACLNSAPLAAQQFGLAPTPNIVPPPVTLWNRLGIPNGMQKMRDVLTNRNGNRPGRERKPPLRRIGDPANLQSKNPAIKTAAEIKNEEDLKKQKIKAIKYLATIGCGCYPGVKEALLAALDDCTEEVRLEAAKAFAQAAGNICAVCAKTCCDAESRAKLADVAFGMDDQGCYKESSPQVRAAALRALNACGGPPPVVQGEPVEVPVPVEPREIPNAPAPPPQVNPGVRSKQPASKNQSVEVVAPQETDAVADAVDTKPATTPAKPTATKSIQSLTDRIKPTSPKAKIDDAKPIESASRAAAKQPATLPVEANAKAEPMAAAVGGLDSLFDGSVAGVDLEHGEVQLAIAHSAESRVGTRVGVYQQQSNRRVRVGELEIVHDDAGVVFARPLGDLDLAQITERDAVMVLSSSTANSSMAQRASYSTR
ncbi:MAG TPA: hypothetical protein VG713_00715 [Pirellulales bacterium]|nr:hypothetical protein [Pirellulales bacterium]